MATNVEFSCSGEWIDGGVAVVTVAGELDIVSADRLRVLLAELRNKGLIKHLVVDLSDVRFIDSSGMGVLVGAQRLAQGPLRVVAPEGFVRRALQLTNLHKVFELADTKAQALRSIMA